MKIDRNIFATNMRELVNRVERGHHVSNEQKIEALEEFEMYYPQEHSFVNGDSLDEQFRDMLEYFGG